MKCEVCGLEFEGLAYKIYEPVKLYVCTTCYIQDMTKAFVSRDESISYENAMDLINLIIELTEPTIKPFSDPLCDECVDGKRCSICEELRVKQ